MLVAETQRLLIRELNSAGDAEFIFVLLNSPKFIEFIGDRGVRSTEQAREFIEKRYRQSYRDHGFGLYAVELKGIRADDDPLPHEHASNVQIGLCGFVKRDPLHEPDLGFAFLPEFERNGYGFESARAVLVHGRDTLGFENVLAITSLGNNASGRLLEKLGFLFLEIRTTPDGDVKLYKIDLLD